MKWRATGHFVDCFIIISAALCLAHCEFSLVQKLLINKLWAECLRNHNCCWAPSTSLNIRTWWSDMDMWYNQKSGSISLQHSYYSEKICDFTESIWDDSLFCSRSFIYLSSLLKWCFICTNVYFKILTERSLYAVLEIRKWKQNENLIAQCMTSIITASYCYSSNALLLVAFGSVQHH